MATVDLHLLRHAHAGDPLKWHGSDDDRPLSSKGRGQAERLGALLAAVGFTTDAIVTSPKVRARQTAEIVADRLGLQPTTDDRLADSLSLAASSGSCPRREIRARSSWSVTTPTSASCSAS